MSGGRLCHDPKCAASYLHFSSDLWCITGSCVSMVLFAALSLHLQHRPYQDEAHNYLESLDYMSGCLAFALKSNMIGRVDLN